MGTYPNSAVERQVVRLHREAIVRVSRLLNHIERDYTEV